MKRMLVALAAVVGIASAIALATPASADPTGPPQYRELAGVGSDTTDPVVNALANAVTVGGVKVLGSYDAAGSATISPKAAANCQNIPRPNGSSAGRDALIAALTPGSATNGCYNFARSSSGPSAGQTSPQPITYVPFAVDAVTFATPAGGVLGTSLTLADLRSIYRDCALGNTPYIPQPGSGTRAFWLGQMQFTEANFANKTDGIADCVSDRDATGALIQEHDGRVLKDSPDSIVPFSLAQYQSQKAGVIADRTGPANVGTVNGDLPTVINPAFDIQRLVYNIVPTGAVDTAGTTTRTVFNGSGSLVCQQSALITTYGFGLTPECGNTSRDVNTTPYVP